MELLCNEKTYKCERHLRCYCDKKKPLGIDEMGL